MREDDDVAGAVVVVEDVVVVVVVAKVFVADVEDGKKYDVISRIE